MVRKKYEVIIVDGFKKEECFNFIISVEVREQKTGYLTKKQRKNEHNKDNAEKWIPEWKLKIKD